MKSRKKKEEALLEAQRESLRDKEPEIIQNEAPMTSGVMQGMFSCACEPCAPVSGGACEPVSGDPVLVSALPSSQVNAHLAVTTAKLDAATARIASMEEVTTAKLDAATARIASMEEVTTARIASMEEELALLRSLNKDRLQALQSAEVEGLTMV